MKLFLLLLTLSSLGINGDSPFLDFCKLYDCNFETHSPTELVTDSTLFNGHTVLDHTFSYFANVSYASNATLLPSSNSIELGIFIFGLKYDACFDGNLCWMRVRVTSEYQLEDQFLEGYYNFENNTLSLFPTLMYRYPSHPSNTTYMISLETCIVSPLTPDRNH